MICQHEKYPEGYHAVNDRPANTAANATAVAKLTGQALLEHRFSVLQKSIHQVNHMNEQVVHGYIAAMFDGSNYAEHLLHDCDFMAGCSEMCALLNMQANELVGNPFFMPGGVPAAAISWDQAQDLPGPAPHPYPAMAPARPLLNPVQSQLVGTLRALDFAPAVLQAQQQRRDDMQDDEAVNGSTQRCGELVAFPFTTDAATHTWPAAAPFSTAKHEREVEAIAMGQSTVLSQWGLWKGAFPPGPLAPAKAGLVLSSSNGRGAAERLRVAAAAVELLAEATDLQRVHAVTDDSGWSADFAAPGTQLHFSTLLNDSAKRFGSITAFRAWQKRTVAMQQALIATAADGAPDMSATGVPKPGRRLGQAGQKYRVELSTMQDLLDNVRSDATDNTGRQDIAGIARWLELLPPPGLTQYGAIGDVPELAVPTVSQSIAEQASLAANSALPESRGSLRHVDEAALLDVDQLVEAALPHSSHAFGRKAVGTSAVERLASFAQHVHEEELHLHRTATMREMLGSPSESVASPTWGSSMLDAGCSPSFSECDDETSDEDGGDIIGRGPRAAAWPGADSMQASLQADSPMLRPGSRRGASGRPSTAAALQRAAIARNPTARSDQIVAQALANVRPATAAAASTGLQSHLEGSPVRRHWTSTGAVSRGESRAAVSPLFVGRSLSVHTVDEDDVFPTPPDAISELTPRASMSVASSISRGDSAVLGPGNSRASSLMIPQRSRAPSASGTQTTNTASIEPAGATPAALNFVPMEGTRQLARRTLQGPTTQDFQQLERAAKRVTSSAQSTLHKFLQPTKAARAPHAGPLVRDLTAAGVLPAGAESIGAVPLATILRMLPHSDLQAMQAFKPVPEYDYEQQGPVDPDTYLKPGKGHAMRKAALKQADAVARAARPWNQAQTKQIITRELERQQRAAGAQSQRVADQPQPGLDEEVDGLDDSFLARSAQLATAAASRRSTRHSQKGVLAALHVPVLASTAAVTAHCATQPLGVGAPGQAVFEAYASAANTDPGAAGQPLPAERGGVYDNVSVVALGATIAASLARAKDAAERDAHISGQDVTQWDATHVVDHDVLRKAIKSVYEDPDDPYTIVKTTITGDKQKLQPAPGLSSHAAELMTRMLGPHTVDAELAEAGSAAAAELQAKQSAQLFVGTRALPDATTAEVYDSFAAAAAARMAKLQSTLQDQERRGLTVQIESPRDDLGRKLRDVAAAADVELQACRERSIDQDQDADERQRPDSAPNVATAIVKEHLEAAYVQELLSIGAAATTRKQHKRGLQLLSGRLKARFGVQLHVDGKETQALLRTGQHGVARERAKSERAASAVANQIVDALLQATQLERQLPDYVPGSLPMRLTQAQAAAAMLGANPLHVTTAKYPTQAQVLTQQKALAGLPSILPAVPTAVQRTLGAKPPDPWKVRPGSMERVQRPFRYPALPGLDHVSRVAVKGAPRRYVGAAAPKIAAEHAHYYSAGAQRAAEMGWTKSHAPIPQVPQPSQDPLQRGQLDHPNTSWLASAGGGNLLAGAPLGGGAGGRPKYLWNLSAAAVKPPAAQQAGTKGISAGRSLLTEASLLREFEQQLAARRAAAGLPDEVPPAWMTELFASVDLSEPSWQAKEPSTSSTSVAGAAARGTQVAPREQLSSAMLEDIVAGTILEMTASVSSAWAPDALA